MPNAYSVPQRFANYIDPIDNNRLDNVLAVKQQRFDSNLQQVNEAIQTFGNVDLMRDKDKEYLLNNLQSVITTLDNTDNIDFSQSGVGSEIATHLSKAIDDEVLTQSANTRNIRNYKNTVEEIKAKKPDSYAAQNDWFAQQQSGLGSYLNGDSNTLGELNFNPYVDYNKEIDDNLIKWAKDIGISTFYEPGQVDGISFQMDGKQLTRSQVKSFVRGNLNSQYTNQIYIDSAYNYKDNPDSDIINTYKNYHSDNRDRSILMKKEKRIELTNQGLPKSEIDEVLKAYDEQIAFHESSSKKKIDRGQAIQYLSLESYLDTKAASYSKKEYNKVSPDGNDIRRAELQLKRAKEAREASGSLENSSSSSSSRRGSSTALPGTIIPNLNPTEGAGTRKDSLQKSALDEYEKNREEYLNGLLADPEFKKEYNSLRSEEARNQLFQLELDKDNSVTLGGQARPELSKVRARLINSTKNLNVINDTYRNTLDEGAVQLYNSLVDEVNSEGSDLNLEGYARLHPNTARLIREKGKNINEQDLELIRYETVKDLKGIGGMTPDTQNAIENYELALFDKVKNTPGAVNPRRESNFLNGLSNVGSTFSDFFTRVGSGFDEEVQADLARDRVRKDFSVSGLFNEAASVALTVPNQIANLFTADEDISELDEEDVQLRIGGDAITPQQHFQNLLSQAETEVKEDLQGSEQLGERGFTITLDPVTAKSNPKIRRDTANFLAERTGADIKNTERLSISLDNTNKTATIKEIDNKEGVIPITVNQNELPEDLLAQFVTKQQEWSFDARNSKASPPVINYPMFRDKSTAINHLNNLESVYGIINADTFGTREQARKRFAPTQTEIYSALKRAYPNKDQESIVRMLNKPYKIKMTPEPSRGVFRYSILDGDNKVFEEYTDMQVFDEGIAAANSIDYLMDYFKAELGE